MNGLEKVLDAKRAPVERIILTNTDSADSTVLKLAAAYLSYHVCGAP